MRVVIAGCGRVGREVAVALADLGDDVSIIDKDAASFQRLLGRSFDGTFHQGLAYDVDVLREAGLDEAGVFLAVTNNDNANLMAVQVAHEVFGVPKAIARLDDPAREDSYRALNVSFVAGAKLVSEVLSEMVHEPEFSYHLTFHSGPVHIVEMLMGEACSGLRIGDLEISRRLRVAAVQRSGSVVIPGDDYELIPGDLVVAAVRKGTASRVAKYLAATPEDRP